MCSAGLDIAMHNEPGYPLKGWFIPPQFSPYPETEALVKPDNEPLTRPEAETYIKPDMEFMPKPDIEKVTKFRSGASKNAISKASKRPKSESEADRYYPG
jgi:hypothetical protein